MPFTTQLSSTAANRMRISNLISQITLREPSIRALPPLRQLTTRSGPQQGSGQLEAAQANYSSGLTEEASKRKHGDTISQVLSQSSHGTS